MANLKFSDFTPYATTPLTATSGLVAYEGTTNIQFSPAELAPFTGIYAANGTIGTTRKALITDTIQFRNAGDTSDILKLNTDGTFTLGLGASATVNNQVAIGASGGNSIAIGRSSSSGADGIAMGASASAGANGVAMGQSSAATGNGVAIGFDAEAPASSIGLGANAKGSGANSITLNANGSAVTPSAANAFRVYMTSSTTPDLEVAGGGTSTLRTNLNVISSTTDYNGIVAKFGNVTSPSNRNTNHVFYTQGQSGGYAHIAQGQMGTGRIFLHGYGFSSIYGMMLKASQDNYLIIGPQTSSTDGNETLRVTSSGLSVGVGGANTARLHVKGSGNTNATTSLLVENSDGDDLLHVKDNGTVKITGQAYTELHANATNLVVSWDDSNIQTVTISGSVPVFAPTNPKAGATYILAITQGATPVTVDWNSLVKWPGGTAPTLSAVTGKIDVITLICYDDSTTNGLYYGSATLDLA
jgi:hypothetical protein